MATVTLLRGTAVFCIGSNNFWACLFAELEDRIVKGKERAPLSQKKLEVRLRSGVENSKINSGRS
jgi:hypothetical protein